MRTLHLDCNILGCSPQTDASLGNARLIAEITQLRMRGLFNGVEEGIVAQSQVLR